MRWVAVRDWAVVIVKGRLGWFVTRSGLACWLDCTLDVAILWLCWVVVVVGGVSRLSCGWGGLLSVVVELVWIVVVGGGALWL